MLLGFKAHKESLLLNRSLAFFFFSVGVVMPPKISNFMQRIARKEKLDFVKINLKMSMKDEPSLQVF